MTARITPARLREHEHHLATDDRDAPLPDDDGVTLDATERGMLLEALRMAAAQIESAQQAYRAWAALPAGDARETDAGVLIGAALGAEPGAAVPALASAAPQAFRSEPTGIPSPYQRPPLATVEGRVAAGLPMRGLTAARMALDPRPEDGPMPHAEPGVTVCAVRRAAWLALPEDRRTMHVRLWGLQVPDPEHCIPCPAVDAGGCGAAAGAGCAETGGDEEDARPFAVKAAGLDEVPAVDRPVVADFLSTMRARKAGLESLRARLAVILDAGLLAPSHAALVEQDARAVWGEGWR